MINEVILIGRWGKDPEIKTAQSGTVIASSSIATSKKLPNGEKTTWHNIVAFGKTAEAMEKFCRKGRLAYIRGEIDNQQYEAKDGTKKYITKIIVNQFRNLEWTDSTQGTQGEQRDDHVSTEDVPF